MVRSVSLLQNVGKFGNVNAGAVLPFAKLTVIYAENARGKSTLAAIMRSLGANLPDLVTERRKIGSQHPPHVVVDLDGGAPAIFQNATWSRNQPDIVVFDDVFVAENVCSGIEVEARHRQNLHELIIGAPGVALNSTLRRRVDQIELHNRQLRERADAIPARVRNGLEVDAFCAITPVPDLVRELEAADRRVTAAKSAARIAEASTFTPIDLPSIDLGPIEETLLSALPGLEADAFRRVQAHLDRLGRGAEIWVNEGMQFVERLEAHGQADCPFCAQTLGGSPILDHYRHYFSDAYRDLKTSIGDTDRAFEASHGGDIPAAFERSVRFVAEGHAFWSPVADIPPLTIDTARVARIWKTAREAVKAALKAKKESPLEPVLFGEEGRRAIEAHNGQCAAIQLINDGLADANPRLDIVKEQAREANLAALTADQSRLRAVEARFEPAIALLCDAYLAEKAAKVATEQARDDARVALENHRRAVIPAYSAAINTFLQRFNASFRIGPVEGINHRGGTSLTYTLMVDGQAVPLSADGVEPAFKNTLSAGDRNTLALAFFFASLEHDPRRANKVVIIDDPMTSLDEHRSLHTRQEIDRLARDVEATLVLSHSKPFLLGVWEQCRQMLKAAIELRRDGGGSTIVVWDVNGDMINEHDRRFSRTVAYIAQADPTTERAVAEGLRPMLEAYCRVAYSSDFPPGSLLGRFLGICAQRIGQPGEILPAQQAAELRALLDFGNRYHHDSNAGWATELINDAELEDFARRTLAFIRRP
ncbi:AAA family ATPase [Mesorhizobium opportunistum]|uniref:AAA family ATPase n=1 Tax=Mesorhizobium opportunistum TaxID=593909 RepID=UPI0033364AA6